ncbi:hypothetical protein [Thalassoglobus polymorphus]|nr:hypothetical protein [Thalassoglobus polymorphus]
MTITANSDAEMMLFNLT